MFLKIEIKRGEKKDKGEKQREDGGKKSKRKIKYGPKGTKVWFGGQKMENGKQ